MLKKRKKGLMWQTMEGEVLHSSQMETSHLFNSVKMIYNHLAELIGFPTFWFNNRYSTYTDLWMNEPKSTMETLKTLVIELEDRTDWNENQKNTYNKIKLTLSGGFHKIVADELSKMGMNIDVMELQNPLTLLLEKKEKNERKQLNSLNR